MGYSYRSAIILGWNIIDVVKECENEYDDFWSMMDNLNFIYDAMHGEYCFIGKIISDIDYNDVPQIIALDDVSMIELKNMAWKEKELFPFQEKIKEYGAPCIYHVSYVE